MWKEALLDYVSQHRGGADSRGSFPQTLPSELAIYSVKSLSTTSETIFALRDCYVDRLAESGKIVTGAMVFELNAFEIDRNTFRLARERTLTEITAARLEQGYLQKLVLGPLEAALQLASSDVQSSQQELKFVHDQFNVGMVLRSEVNLAEARLSEKSGSFLQTERDLAKAKLDIQTQTSRLKAEQADLDERMKLNHLIKDIHAYVASKPGSLECHTFAGAFVEEGDPICTIKS
jgi:hypothetical protein